MTRRALYAGAAAVTTAAATLVSALRHEGSRPWPAVLLLLGCAAAWTAGWYVARDQLLRVAVPAAVAVGAAGAVLLAPDGTSGKALAGPLGYGNANGALCLVGVGATALAVVSLPARWRVLLVLTAVPLGLAFLTRSVAAAALAIPVALSPLLPRRRGVGRAVVLGAAAAPLLALVLTAVAGAVPASALGRSTGETLTERRVVLWSDAIDLTTDHPVTGVGPGRFAVTSPTARADEDARWAHSLVLQEASETGLLGAGAVVALLASLFALLLASLRRDGRAAVGAVLLSAALVQADIDYTAHFPVVPLLLAVVVGTATGGTSLDGTLASRKHDRS